MLGHNTPPKVRRGLDSEWTSKRSLISHTLQCCTALVRSLQVRISSAFLGLPYVDPKPLNPREAPHPLNLVAPLVMIELRQVGICKDSPNRLWFLQVLGHMRPDH